MNLKSILGGKTQDEIIRDSNSALHVHMKNSNTQSNSWITVSDLVNAIEQRLLESPHGLRGQSPLIPHLIAGARRYGR